MRYKTCKRLNACYCSRVLNIVLFVWLIFLFSSSQAFAQQNKESKPEDKAVSLLFYYRNNSKVLSRNYKTNELNYQLLKAMIKSHRKKLTAGDSHLRILSYLFPGDFKDTKAINNGSIQANIMRSLLKVKFLIDTPHVTFFFDTTQVMRNCICVTYIPHAIHKGANQHVFYTFSKRPSVLSYSVSRYGKIPVIGQENQNEFEGKAGKETTDNKVLYAIIPDSIAKPEEDILSNDLAQEITETIWITSETTIDKTFQPLLAFKTNALYWGGIMPELKRRKILPNMEVELYTRRHWSFNADIAYVYMNKRKPDKETWGVFGIGVEPRYWFCKAGTFKGIYAGVYGLYGNFDVKPKGIHSHGNTGDYGEGGLSIGYTLMLSNHWGVEVGGRFGYRHVNGDIYKYIQPNYYRMSSYTENKFKLTGIRLLLTYRIGKKQNEYVANGN